MSATLSSNVVPFTVNLPAVSAVYGSSSSASVMNEEDDRVAYLALTLAIVNLQYNFSKLPTDPAAEENSSSTVSKAEVSFNVCRHSML